MYPLFVIEVQPGAYASIYGMSEHGTEDRAVAVFSDRDLADRYRETEEPKGEIRQLANENEFQTLLRRFNSLDAVAFDVTSAEQGRIAKTCVKIASLLKERT